MKRSSHHGNHQLHHGPTIDPSRRSHTSQLPQDLKGLEALGSQNTPALQHNRTYLGGYGTVATVGASLPGWPTSNETSYNIDGIHRAGYELASGLIQKDEITRGLHTNAASGQGLDDNNGREEASLPWSEPTANVLSYCGSQFDTNTSHNNGHTDQQNLFASTPPTNDLLPDSHSQSIEGDLSILSGATASVADPGHHDNWHTSLRHGRISNSADYQGNQPWQSQSGFREATRPPILDHSLPGIVVSDCTRPVGSDLRAPVQADTTTSMTLIQQAYNISNTLNSQWMSRLEATPDLHKSCTQIPSQSLFEVGLEILRDCYHGVFPNRFSESFALMHVIFAFSSVAANMDGSNDLPNLSQDVYDWQNTIEDADQVRIFVGVWHRVWSDYPNSQLVVRQYHEHSQNQLMGVMVLERCSRFLDGKTPGRYSRNSRLI